MGARVPLLLQPTCPPSDDRGIADFLKVAALLTSARRTSLLLEPDGGSPACRYRLPPDDARPDDEPDSLSLELNPGPDFSARLLVDRAATLDSDTAALLSATLTASLERFRLRAQTSILRAALDTTASSILLFDGRGDIVYANPPADRLLSLQTEDDLLTETEGEEPRPLFSLLCNLVERVVDSAEGRPMWKGRLRTRDGRVMACEVTRLPQQEMRADAVVVLLQQIGGEPEVLIEDFASSFGLSPREQEVLQLLVEGATTLAMAERLGISPHTVRDHLKNLYRKTSTSSRGELLGLLSRTHRSGPERDAP